MGIPFNPERVITKVQIPIVRFCNRRCPDCCARNELTWFNPSTLLFRPIEVSIEELRWTGELLGRVDEIELTGGEPTLHSKFEEITKQLLDLFPGSSMKLVTNGWLFGQDPSKLPLLLHYKNLYLTEYTDAFVDNNPLSGPSNSRAIKQIIEFANKNGVENVHHVAMNNHFSYEPPYKGGACVHNQGPMVAYYDKFIHGCCVSWGLPIKGQPIPLTRQWREHLHEIELPCKHCFLST